MFRVSIKDKTNRRIWIIQQRLTSFRMVAASTAKATLPWNANIFHLIGIDRKMTIEKAASNAVELHDGSHVVIAGAGSCPMGAVEPGCVMHGVVSFTPPIDRKRYSLLDSQVPGGQARSSLITSRQHSGDRVYPEL